MTWVRLDDQFPDHPKVLKVGPEAAWLHVCAICYCARQLTDGYVPEKVIGRLADVKKPLTLINRLVEAGLWVPAQDGWELNDYLSYNPSREKVLADRAAAAERKERWKERRSERVPDGVRNGGKNASPTHPDPARRAKGRGSEEPLAAGSPPAADGGGEQFDPEISKQNAERIAEVRSLLAKQNREAS